MKNCEACISIITAGFRATQGRFLRTTLGLQNTDCSGDIRLWPVKDKVVSILVGPRSSFMSSFPVHSPTYDAILLEEQVRAAAEPSVPAP